LQAAKVAPDRYIVEALSEPSLAQLSTSGWALIDRCALVVADLDGCLTADNVPLDGSAEFVRRVGDRLVVVSNNSTHVSEEMAAHLSRSGLPLRAEQLLMAGEVAVRLIARDRPGARIMIVGTEAIAAAARRAGLAPVNSCPDVVLLTRATSSTLAHLQSAVDALHRGADLVIANPDLTHPGHDGTPRIETGALLALLKAVLPRIAPRIVGKPELSMFEAALATSSSPPDRAVMIGDNLLTDIAGGRRAGMHVIHLNSPLGVLMPTGAVDDAARHFGNV
jgi:4-nitrophenyl phosphatase/NagD protein